MKFFKLATLLILILLLNSCTDESPDCVCTEEFRTYLVTVVDSRGNLVDSLQTTITNEQGKEYAFSTPGSPHIQKSHIL